MLTATLFIIELEWLKCLSVVERLNKLWYIHMLEYDILIKINIMNKSYNVDQKKPDTRSILWIIVFI